MHRKTRVPGIPVAEIVTVAILVALAVGVIVGISALGSPAAAAAPAWQADSAATLAADASHACPAIGVHECITAPRNHAHIAIQDNGIQPLCPRSQHGWVVTFRERGTRFRFNARCDAAGPDVSVWDAIR